MTTGSLTLALKKVRTAAVTAMGRRDQAADLGPSDLAEMIALVADLRRDLADMETDLATALGRSQGPVQGNLADGRQFTLKRTQDRKEWDHDEWKRDARRRIVQDTTDEMGSTIQVLTEDGEVQEFDLGPLLHRAITEAQEVHGSTAPRSTALKRLGLYASDYCTSSPGGWRFNAIHIETTTTKEK